MIEDGFGRIIDSSTEVFLASDGLPGYSIAATVDSDGRTDFWVVARDQVGIAGTDHGTERPPHESCGPLPPHWRSRIERAPIRCGAPTAGGHRCRMRVDQPGSRCHHHQSARRSR